MSDADMIFCSQPRQCPVQNQCARNLDIHPGPVPPIRIYQIFTSEYDKPCPGFLRHETLQSKK